MTTLQTRGIWWGIARTLLLAIVAGAGAGIVSAVWTNRSLNDYSAILLAGKHLPQVSTQKPSPIPGTYEEALSRVRESARTSVATIMPAASDSAVPKDWLNESFALGYGAIVSDNGWVAVDASVIVNIKNPIEEIEVWANGERYSVSLVVQDAQTGIAMLRTNISGISPVGFAATGGVRSGEMMFVIDALGGVLPTALQQSDVVVLSEVQQAESFTTEWVLSSTAFVLSAPIFNAGGELAGFVKKGSANVLPLHHALAAIRSIVKDGKVSPAMFGAYSVDLAHAYNIDADLKQNLSVGALIFAPDTTVHATVRGGPAAMAGFASKDIILAIDGESITESTSLAEILSLYSPGDVARCTVFRSGQTITISVTLADATALVY